MFSLGQRISGHPRVRLFALFHISVLLTIYCTVYIWWVLALTLTGVVGGPVLAGHAHHLGALGLVPLLTAYFTARPHHVVVLLS